MKQNILNLILLLGLTPSFTQPMGKILQFSKKLILNCKRSFTRLTWDKKLAVGLMTGTGITILGDNEYQKYRMVKLIKRYLCMKKYDDQLYHQIKNAISKNKDHATKYVLENFEKIVQDSENAATIVSLIAPNASKNTMQTLISLSIKHRDTILKSYYKSYIFAALGKHSKEISPDLVKLAQDEFAKFITTASGSQFLKSIIQPSTSNLFIEPMKKSIEPLLQQHDRIELIKPILENNPEAVVWICDFSINNFDAFYDPYSVLNNEGFYRGKNYLLSQILPLTNDKDALKLKELITKTALRRYSANKSNEWADHNQELKNEIGDDWYKDPKAGLDYEYKDVQEALIARMKKIDNTKIDSKSSCLFGILTQ